MTMKLVFGSILFIGILSFFSFMFDRMDIAKTSSWPIVEGNLLDIQDKSFSIPILSRFIPIRIPHAKYSYQVDGKYYEGERTSGPTILFVRMATFKQPEMIMPDSSEILRSIREHNTISLKDLISGTKYKPIIIRYETRHPENSMPDPNVLQSGVSLWWTCVILCGVGGLGLTALFYHDHTIKPVDDPSLSLESALAAQRRRRG